MATAIGVIVGIVVVLLIAGLVLLAMRRAQRRRELQEQYGPEYDRAVEQSGSRSAAERDLAARREQRAQLQIVPLAPESRQRYSQSWTQVQGRFVDDPQGAVTDADDLVTSVMRERGYPTEGFDEQARLLSVDHANTLDNYRSGHQIAGLARQQQATTEQLRQGMVHYRTLFRELVEEQGHGESQGQGQFQPQQGQGQYQPQQGQGQYQPQQGQGQFQQGQPQQAQYPQGQDAASSAQYAQPGTARPMEAPTQQMPQPPMPPMPQPQTPQPQTPQNQLPTPDVQPGYSSPGEGDTVPVERSEPYPGEETNPQGLRRQT